MGHKKRKIARLSSVNQQLFNQNVALKKHTAELEATLQRANASNTVSSSRTISS